MTAKIHHNTFNHKGHFLQALLMDHRMKSKTIITAVILSFILIPMQLFAHHNWLAQYDPDKPVIVFGTVVQLQMVNPHVRLFVNEELENGEIFQWNFELAAASMLMRAGIRRDTLNPGDIVEVHATLARNADNIANVGFFIQYDASGNEVFRFGNFSARE